MAPELLMEGALPVVVAPVRLDTLGAPVFDATLVPLLAEPRPRLLLDFHRTTYISSAGLRSVLMLIKHAARAGGKLMASGVSEPIAEILEMSGFVSLIEIYSDRAEAVAAQHG